MLFHMDTVYKKYPVKTNTVDTVHDIIGSKKSCVYDNSGLFLTQIWFIIAY